MQFILLFLHIFHYLIVYNNSKQVSHLLRLIYSQYLIVIKNCAGLQRCKLQNDDVFRLLSVFAFYMLAGDV